MLKRKLNELNNSVPITTSKKPDQAAKSTKPTSDKLIDDANDLPPSEFQRVYIRDDLLSYSPKSHKDDGDSYEISVKCSSQLHASELNACFKLIESTSRADYEPSTFGWHPKRKKREMKEAEMRYLLVRTGKGEAQTLPSETEDDAIEGFLSFMLTHDSSPAVPVLYVYEIHLSDALRKVGLGGHLMRIAESVARRVGVEKVMLTCFVSNTRARCFYERRGYAEDICSPQERKTRLKITKPDYVIMSKSVAEVT